MFRRLKANQRSRKMAESENPVDHGEEITDVAPRKDPSLSMAPDRQGGTKFAYPPPSDPGQGEPRSVDPRPVDLRPSDSRPSDSRPKMARIAAKLAAPVDGVVTVKRGEGRKMVVGREICLSGEIKSCDTLVVEGRVEADLKDCRTLVVLASGVVKGNATVERCEISGLFEGDLTARQHLLLRATGRIIGSVTYDQLEVERGGSITGRMTETGGSSNKQDGDLLAPSMKETGMRRHDSELEEERARLKALQASA
jgi:cytoskeletal protein CcmA (bactofilin family)